MLHKTLGKHAHHIVTAKNMRRLKWASVLAGFASLGVMFILKENHMVSTAVSAVAYEGTKLMQEVLEPFIRSMENLTEAAEEVAELAGDAVEALEA